MQAEVSDLADLDVLYAHMKEKNRRLDLLVANVGAGEILPPNAIT